MSLEHGLKSTACDVCLVSKKEMAIGCTIEVSRYNFDENQSGYAENQKKLPPAHKTKRLCMARQVDHGCSQGDIATQLERGGVERVHDPG